MRYVSSLPFRGDTEKSFALAETALTAIGFRLTQRTAGSLELLGPGMNSTRQSALLGASRIQLTSGSGKMAVDAELGGVARMSRFVTFFPISLVLFLGLLLSAIFSVVFGPGGWIGAIVAAVVGNAVLWVFLGPWMAGRIRVQTNRALETLLANMVSVGESAAASPT